jgi:spore coat protein U-like protein
MNPMNVLVHCIRRGRPLAPLCLAAGLLLPPLPALAQLCTASATTVSIGSSVDVVSGANYSGSGNYTITCNIGLLGVGSANISACINIPGASGATPRTLNNGANTLAYNLYSDSAHTTVWGTYGGSPGIPNPPNPVNLTVSSLLLGGTVTSSAVPIYGYLQSSQNTTAIADTYTATPAATLTYNYSYSTLFSPGTPPACTSGPSGSNGSSAFALTVNATVINDCIASASTINFGSGVGVLSSAIAVTGTITAKCTSGDVYTIALNKGTTTGASLSDRQMAGSGSAVVHYQLYTDSGHSTVWGDGTSGTSTAGGTGNGATQSYNVYGLVPAQTTPAPNTYSDTVLVTVTY